MRGKKECNDVRGSVTQLAIYFRVAHANSLILFGSREQYYVYVRTRMRINSVRMHVRLHADLPCIFFARTQGMQYVQHLLCFFKIKGWAHRDELYENKSCGTVKEFERRTK